MQIHLFYINIYSLILIIESLEFENILYEVRQSSTQTEWVQLIFIMN